jgi:hypothetical protein
VNWKPTDEGHEAAAGEWTVGDHVAARANEIKVRAGSRGTVVGFSAVGGHPLVDFVGFGLVLIRAEHLARDDDSTTEARVPARRRSPGTTRLSDTPRPAALAVAPLPPPPDWFDRPPLLQLSHERASTPDHSDEIDLGLPADLDRRGGRERSAVSREPSPSMRRADTSESGHESPTTQEWDLQDQRPNRHASAGGQENIEA